MQEKSHSSCSIYSYITDFFKCGGTKIGKRKLDSEEGTACCQLFTTNRGGRKALSQLILMDQGWKSSDNDISAYLVEPKPPADSRRKQPAYRTAGSDKSTGTYSDQPPSESLQHSAATQEDLLGRAPDASLIAKSSAATATDTADSVLYPISYPAATRAEAPRLADC